LTASRPLIFFSGKGGVGKTTMAAAAALLHAQAGVRTLLVSTDPAHSTADVLGVALGAEPREIADLLHAVEIDADQAAAAHIEDIKRQVAGSVDRDLLPAVYRHLDLARGSPGTVESALFDQLAGLMDRCPDEFDRVIFDTAPTGHTLRLLALPALLSAWVEGLARQREKVAGMERMLRNMAGRDDPGGDPVLEALHERRARFERAARRLHDDADFWLVLVPERLPIEETARAERALSEGGLRVAGLVVNRVLPDDAEGAFLAARREQQQAYEKELGSRFPGRRIVRVAQRPRDVAGLADLAALTDTLPAELAA
jgi:arsenite/tail-anchored protein-transporting ATPase